MRISDWSSDVCSSDLLRRLCTARDAPAREHIDQPRPPVDQVAALQPLDPGGRGRQVEQRHRLVNPLRFDQSVVGNTQPIEEGAEQQRSEEHTSELQSLMRISYAVFCLKKKKNNINKQYNQHK